MTMTATPTSVLVAAEEAGERLDRVLARHLAEPPLSRSRLKALIEQGAVALDGQTIRDPSHRVNSGDADRRRRAAGRAGQARGGAHSAHCRL